MIKQKDDDDCSIIDKNLFIFWKSIWSKTSLSYVKKREKSDLQNLKYPKAFIEYSNNMLEVYKNIEEYNPSRKSNVLIVLHDMISDMISNKKFSPIVTELLIRARKLNTFTFLSHNLISKYQKMQD